MKYTSEIEINLPREKVIELFDNKANLKHWQEGLQSFEHLSGDPGTIGSKYTLKYKMGKRNIEMTETILKRESSNFDFLYEAKGVWNEVKNSFSEIDQNQTKWTIENDFRGKGMMAIMLFLMPSMFKKQTMKFMNSFKKFTENHK
jgi:hypothetical protein